MPLTAAAHTALQEQPGGSCVAVVVQPGGGPGDNGLNQACIQPQVCYTRRSVVTCSTLGLLCKRLMVVGDWAATC